MQRVWGMLEPKEFERCFCAWVEAVRKHWGIENSLHWCLNMTLREDYSRTRKDHSAENMAVVRHMALNILKTTPQKSVLHENAAVAPMTTISLPKSWIAFMRKLDTDADSFVLDRRRRA